MTLLSELIPLPLDIILLIEEVVKKDQWYISDNCCFWDNSLYTFPFDQGLNDGYKMFSLHMYDTDDYDTDIIWSD